jgi:Glycosyltransferase family 87
MQFAFKLLVIIIIPITGFIFYLSQKKNSRLLVPAKIYLLLLFIPTLLSIGTYVYLNYDHPPKWDFFSFWLNGKVGISGENFYDAENYQAIQLPYEPGEELRQEIIDTAFWYPPFAMFLFLPLGLFDMGNAYVFWQILTLLICCACIYLLWKLFLNKYKVLGLLLVAVLLIRLEPARLTFNYSQTNFITLLFFLLFWKNRDKATSGIWLALSVMVKPYMVFLYIYPLLIRNWRMLSSAILTLIALSVLSILAFGFDIFVSYLDNPVPQTPVWNYIEISNQSLLATLLRTNDQLPTGHESLLSHPVYAGVSFVMTLITVWVTVKKDNNHDWAILSILFLALIVYPANQVFYSVFLIVPVALLLQNMDRNTKERWIIFFIIFITYLLSGYDSGNYMFFANLFMWFVCIIIALRSSIENMPASDSLKLSSVS